MTYTAIPDSDKDANSPVTESLITLLRDNPIAIAAADSGAPLIQNLDRSSLKDAATGSEHSAEAVEEVIKLGATFQKAYEFVTPYGGTFDFSWQHKRQDGNGQVESRIYRNGSGVGTLKTRNVNDYVTVTDTVSGWSDSDLIQLYVRNNSGGINAFVKNFKILESRTYDLHRIRAAV